MIPPVGILQGRLTPSPDGSIQFFPQDNWFNEFAIAHNAGFDCIELLLKMESQNENPFMTDAGRNLISILADENKLATYSVHAFYDKTQEYPSILEGIVGQAFLLGIKTILISFFKQNSLSNEEDKALARSQLGQVLSFCKFCDIQLGIETELEAPELLRFIQSFDHTSIGVYYDIGNMASMGVDLVEEIRLLGGHICGVHVKDRLANGGVTVPLGEGCADFEAAFTALHQVGYRAPFILQGARVAGVDDVELNQKYLSFCRSLLTKTYGGC